MAGKINTKDLCNQIYDTICNNHADSSAFRKLLYDNVELTRHQPVNSEFVVNVVDAILDCRNVKIVDDLIEFLEPEATDDFEKQLIMAALQGNLEKFEFLLKNKVNVEDLKNNWKYTGEYELPPALFSSVLLPRNLNKNKEMLRLLINIGVNIHIENSDYENLYHSLAQLSCGTAEIAETLFESGLTAIDEPTGIMYRSPLQNAICVNNLELVQFFINKGADVHRSEDTVHKFPLSEASSSGNEEIIDVLVANGADVNACESDEGWTFLHFNCALQDSHRPNAIRLMLKKGADMDVEDYEGKTPISLLKSDFNNYQECLVIMVKALANSTSISKKNMDYIQSDLIAEELLDKCSTELSKMKNKLFYAPFSYYSVLQMSKNLKKLANLTRNNEFVAAFETNLDSCPLYAEDLKTVVADATRVRNESDMIILYLKSAFGDFFPDVVLDCLSKNLNVKDIKFE